MSVTVVSHERQQVGLPLPHPNAVLIGQPLPGPNDKYVPILTAESQAARLQVEGQPNGGQREGEGAFQDHDVRTAHRLPHPLVLCVQTSFRPVVLEFLVFSMCQTLIRPDTWKLAIQPRIY